MRKIKKYLQSLKVLKMSPRDIIVLEVSKDIPENVYARIKAQLRPIFPEHKIIILK